MHSRYDPSGLGESEGVSLMESKFSLWLEDAKEMLLKVAVNPQIVVCSSMGCWVSIMLWYMCFMLYKRSVAKKEFREDLQYAAATKTDL